MKGTFHGITSILLIFTSLVIGLYQISVYSSSYALIYGFSLLIGSYIIIQVYCTKCPCKEYKCAHFFPGFIARFLPAQKPGRYKPTEIFTVIAIIIFWLGFPQKWLYQNGDLAIIFWLLLITGFYQIVRFVCPKCDNEFCPANKKKHEAD